MGLFIVNLKIGGHLWEREKKTAHDHLSIRQLTCRHGLRLIDPERNQKFQEKLECLDEGDRTNLHPSGVWTREGKDFV
jgi:hypothetical protein